VVVVVVVLVAGRASVCVTHTQINSGMKTRVRACVCRSVENQV